MRGDHTNLFDFEELEEQPIEACIYIYIYIYVYRYNEAVERKSMFVQLWALPKQDIYACVYLFPKRLQLYKTKQYMYVYTYV